MPGRTYKFARSGSVGESFSTRAVNSATRESIDGTGITVLNTTEASQVYTMAPPVKSARKTIVWTNPSSVPVVVRASTGTDVTINTTPNTQLTFDTSVADVAYVNLIGINSTLWVCGSKLGVSVGST